MATVTVWGRGRKQSLATLEADFEPEPNTGCWLWTKTENVWGYGRVNYHGKMWGAHRLLYTLIRGPIPGGMDLDHLCRVRSCVNPWHLEPVTERDNVLRSPLAIPAVNARKTTCGRGHEYKLVTWKQGTKRICPTCRNDRARRNDG